jgi:hypothetical protein
MIFSSYIEGRKEPKLHGWAMPNGLASRRINTNKVILLKIKDSASSNCRRDTFTKYVHISLAYFDFQLQVLWKCIPKVVWRILVTELRFGDRSRLLNGLVYVPVAVTSFICLWIKDYGPKKEQESSELGDERKLRGDSIPSTSYVTDVREIALTLFSL